MARSIKSECETDRDRQSPSDRQPVKDHKRDRQRNRATEREHERKRERPRDKDHARERERTRERGHSRDADHPRDRERDRRPIRHEHERHQVSQHSSISGRRSDRQAERPSSPPRRRYFDDGPFPDASNTSRHTGRNDNSNYRSHHDRRPAESTRSADNKSTSMGVDDMEDEQAAADAEPKLTEEEILEQARRKRAAILAKHKLASVVNPSHVSTITADPAVPLTSLSMGTSTLGSTCSSASSKPPLHQFTSETSLRVSALNSPAGRLRLGTDTPQQITTASDHASG